MLSVNATLPVSTVSALTPCPWERGRSAFGSLASFQRPPGTMERHPALPAAPIGRSLNDRGRRRERSSSVQVFRWPVLQVASPTVYFRDECSSRASVFARGRLTDRGEAGR